MYYLTRIPQVVVAWTLNIVAIALIAVGMVLRITAEWIYGVKETTTVEAHDQFGEMDIADLQRIRDEHLSELESSESDSDPQEKTDRKIH